MLRSKTDRLIALAIKKGMRLDGRGRLILASGRAFSGALNTTKRKRFNLNVGKGTTVHLARVLCWLYHGPPPIGRRYDAEHKNQNPTDDRPKNLRWATRSVNVKNTAPYYHGPRPKLNKIQTKKILSSQSSIRQLAKQFCVGGATIGRVFHGQYSPVAKF